MLGRITNNSERKIEHFIEHKKKFNCIIRYLHEKNL